jgi:tRNA-dihydrouridine synthase
VIEPRIKGDDTLHEGHAAVAVKYLRPHFSGPIIAAGGFDGASAEAIVASGDADLVAFGRHFSSNPDLPYRLQHNLPLTPYVRDAFWGGDEKNYSDFPRLRRSRDGVLLSNAVTLNDYTSSTHSYHEVPMSRTVQFAKAGGPEVLEFVEASGARARPAKFASKSRRSASTAPNRCGAIDDYIEPVKFPAGLGYEAAGIVDAVGAEVTTASRPATKSMSCRRSR